MAWITTKDGRHINTDWFDEKMREKYSAFINDSSRDNSLDSDEKVWVQALRAEAAVAEKDRQIAKQKEEGDRLNAQAKAADIKPWSNSENKRSKEMTKFVMDHLRAGDEWSEFYEENVVEEYDPIPLKFPGFKNDEISISKMNLVYTQNYDENDRRVKKGKALAGSTYYVVQTDDGSIDESNFAYKTRPDAEHAMKLFIQDLTALRNKR